MGKDRGSSPNRLSFSASSARHQDVDERRPGSPVIRLNRQDSPEQLLCVERPSVHLRCKGQHGRHVERILFDNRLEKFHGFGSIAEHEPSRRYLQSIVTIAFVLDAPQERGRFPSFLSQDVHARTKHRRWKTVRVDRRQSRRMIFEAVDVASGKGEEARKSESVRQTRRCPQSLANFVRCELPLLLKQELGFGKELGSRPPRRRGRKNIPELLDTGAIFQRGFAGLVRPWGLDARQFLFGAQETSPLKPWVA